MFINHSKMIKKGGGRGGAIIGILMLLLLTINPVYAQTEIPPTLTPENPVNTPTPVPTSTRTPYYAPTNQLPISGTATPLVQGDCPRGARDLDRELSLKWMKACSKCPTTGRSVITPIPRLPTISYGNLETPMATPMGTPGITPTPSNSDNMTVYLDVGVALPHPEPNTIVTHNSILKRSFGTSFHTDQRYGWPLPKKFGVHVWGQTTITRSSGVATINISFRAARFFNADLEIVEYNRAEFPVGTIYHLNALNDYVTVTRNIATIGSSWSTTQSWDIKFNITLIADNSYGPGEFFNQYIVPGGQLSAMTTTYNMEYQLDSWADINSGYCNNYVYADEEEADDPLVGMPDISIWQGVCLDFVPPFSWFRDSAGSYLFDVDLSFPGIGICPIWVELGDMELAGITIPMDILFLPAVMFIFGLLFKM